MLWAGFYWFKKWDFLYYEARGFTPIGTLTRPGLRLRFSPRRRIEPLRAGGQSVGAYAPVGEHDFPGISCYCHNILEAAPT